MSYWTDDWALKMQQRILDAEQHEAEQRMEAGREERRVQEEREMAQHYQQHPHG